MKETCLSFPTVAVFKQKQYYKVHSINCVSNFHCIKKRRKPGLKENLSSATPKVLIGYQLLGETDASENTISPALNQERHPQCLKIGNYSGENFLVCINLEAFR